MTEVNLAKDESRRSRREGAKGPPRAWLKDVRVLAPLIFVVIVAVFAGAAAVHRLGSRASVMPGTTSRAKRGNLLITVVEKGVIKSKAPTKIRSELRRPAKIVKVVEEGTTVTKDTPLIEFDKTEFEQELRQQKDSLEASLASLRRAEEEVNIQQLQNENSLDAARLKVLLAERDLEKFLGMEVSEEDLAVLSSLSSSELAKMEVAGDEARLRLATDSTEASNNQSIVLFRKGGEAYQALREAEVKVEKQKTTLAWAEKDMNAMPDLVRDGYKTTRELEQARIRFKEAEAGLESAQLERALLLSHSLVKDVMQKVSEVVQARRALDQAERRAESEMAQKQANLMREKSQKGYSETRVKEMEDILEKCVIRSPCDGVVIIGEEDNPYWKDQIRPGGIMYWGYTLITIPDLSASALTLEVKESDIECVKVGLPCNVTFDSLPGVTLKGKVIRIADVATSPELGARGTDAKVLKVEVEMLETDERLRPGSSAQVEILVDELKDVLTVPVEAIYAEGSVERCYVLERGQPVAREVKTGKSNEHYVEIREGLKESEIVCLYVPELEAAASSGGA